MSIALANAVEYRSMWIAILDGNTVNIDLGRSQVKHIIIV